MAVAQRRCSAVEEAQGVQSASGLTQCLASVGDRTRMEIQERKMGARSKEFLGTTKSFHQKSNDLK